MRNTRQVKIKNTTVSISKDPTKGWNKPKKKLKYQSIVMPEKSEGRMYADYVIYSATRESRETAKRVEERLKR